MLIWPLLFVLPIAFAAENQNWNASWTASPQQAGELEPRVVENVTLREIVHLSSGGKSARVKFSNLYGKSPLKISAATIGVQEKNGACLEASALRFSGRQNASISAGEELRSDSAELPVSAHLDLCITFHLPGKTELRTIHAVSQASDLLAAGNQVNSQKLEKAETLQSRFFLSGVETAGSPSQGVVVVMGDSITDGQGSSMDNNQRWPDLLAERMAKAGATMSVVNAGISSNRLLRPSADAELPFKVGDSGLARFEREVLEQPGVTHAVVLLGINDLGHPGSVAPLSESVQAQQLIKGYQQLIAKAHARGTKIIGATLLPFQGVIYDGYYTPEKEKIRQEVNRWIRQSGAYDGFIDFDLALRDPAQPLKLLPKYDSGDHIHPSDAGYKAMAEAAKLDLFLPRKRAAEADAEPAAAAQSAE